MQNLIDDSDIDVAVIACMKDEGPFILEWVSYHRSIGIRDFVIISNDCCDGTDLILDRLDDLGIVKHLPNPSMLDLFDEPVQHVAIAYAQLTKEIKRADWVLIIDADEFLNIQVGDGSLSALFEAIGDVDAISFNQVVFGSSSVVEFRDRPTLEQFTYRFRFERPSSEVFPRMYGIKTLARNDTKLFRRHANHRPIPFRRRATPPKWLDGSGQDMPDRFQQALPRGHRSEYGSHSLAYINHYAVRAAQTFILQSFRGDAVDSAIRRDYRYWQRYDRNDIKDETILDKAEKAKPELARLMEDESLRKLHNSAVDYYHEKLRNGLRKDEVRKLYEHITMPKSGSDG